MTVPHDLFDKFSLKYDKLLNPIIKSLQNRGYTVGDIDKNIDNFISSIFKTNKIENAISNIIVELTINATVLGGIPIVKNKVENLAQALLKNNWFSDDLALSKRLHKRVGNIKTGVSSILKETLGQSVNWNKTAQSIFKIKDLKADLPKFMKKLIKQGNKVLVDPSLIAQFRKQTQVVRKQINKLSNLGYQNPRLKKAYNNIIKQIEKSSGKGLKKAIVRAIKAKTKYYAERIARTEISAAYGNSVVWHAQKDERTVAIKSSLSSRHNILDICDVHAKVDQYGLGKGVFPKRNVPPFPYHPNCM